jgi:hypothetical protein
MTGRGTADISFSSWGRPASIQTRGEIIFRGRYVFINLINLLMRLIWTYQPVHEVDIKISTAWRGWYFHINRIVRVIISAPLSPEIFKFRPLLSNSRPEGVFAWNQPAENTVPFLRNFHWGGKTGKKGRTKNMSRRGLANARVWREIL